MPPPTSLAPTTQQKLIGANFANLKNLCDVSFDFSQTPLTAIMGANRSGKTTVLHALACVYKPENGDGYRFTNFFKPTTDGTWAGSRFSITYQERHGENLETLTKEFGKAEDRWTPRYEKRPIRPISYTNIRDSVPDVEYFENRKGKIHCTHALSSSELENKIRKNASDILNAEYSELCAVNYDCVGQTRRKSISVTSDSIRYSGLSMSAGELRIIRILREVFSAPKYALILIDEIDIFLHQHALKKLLQVLHKYAEHNRQQIIFTTHFPSIGDLYNNITVYSLHPAPRGQKKTQLWIGHSPEALYAITGTQEKPIEIWTEDDVATAIISRICHILQIKKFVSIHKYGAASNGFTIAANLAYRNAKNSLVVLDGDCFTSETERLEQIKKVLSGTGPHADSLRTNALSHIRAFTSNDKISPEAMIRVLVSSADNRNESEYSSIVDTIASDPHIPFKEIIDRMGESPEVVHKGLTDLASKGHGWEAYIATVKDWLEDQCSHLNLTTSTTNSVNVATV